MDCDNDAGLRDDALDAALESEKTANVGLPWARLPKWERVKRLAAFADVYAAAEGLDEAGSRRLHVYLRKALEAGRIQRARDVVYDKGTGMVSAIPGLSRAPDTGRFTLRSNVPVSGARDKE